MQNKNKKISFFIARAAIIAALYVVLTLALHSISFREIQFRVSEALVMLAYADVAAIPGVAIGCMLANLSSPFGLVDILGGSAITLVAAYLTYKIKNRYLAALPPVILNALGVSLYISFFVESVPYWLIVLQIALGEAGVVYLLGLPVLALYEKVMERF